MAALVLATMLGSVPATANGIGAGCDTIDGRDGGMEFCDSGLICTGPFEGSYGHGNCQASGGGGTSGVSRAQKSFTYGPGSHSSS